MFRSLRISHVEFRFPGSEKLGPSRNGRMERNFPVIPIFRNFRPTSRDTPKISKRNSGKCPFHSLHNPEFPEFFSNGKRPRIKDVRANCLSQPFCAGNATVICHAPLRLTGPEDKHGVENAWQKISGRVYSFGSSVTPIFLIMNHLLYLLSTKYDKMKKISP